MIKIAVANVKGGVGKTTSVIHTGVALAEMGYRVLLIDLDPQSTLTTQFVANMAGHLTMMDVLVSACPIADVLIEVRRNLTLLPSTLLLADSDVRLAQMPAGDMRLRRALEAQRGHDLCLIDCPPSLGKLTFNALMAADYVLVPVDSGAFALQGLGMLGTTVRDVQSFNRDLRYLGVFLSRADITNVTREIRTELEATFPVETFEVSIRNAVRIREAAIKRETLYDGPHSPVRDDFEAFASEILSRLRLIRPVR